MPPTRRTRPERDEDDRTAGPPSASLPGGPAAVARGCTCPVLANAAYRTGAPDRRPLLEPDCPVHALRHDDVARR